MAMKFKVLIISMCVLLFTVGFAVSAYAFTPCGIICADALDACLNSGVNTPEQCQIEYIACIRDCT